MLRGWQPHADYQQYFLSVLPHFLDTDRNRLVALESSISKSYLLDLDKVYSVVEGLYSGTGKAAKNKQAIIRSFALMIRVIPFALLNALIHIMAEPFILSPG